MYCYISQLKVTFWKQHPILSFVTVLYRTSGLFVHFSERTAKAPLTTGVQADGVSCKLRTGISLPLRCSRLTRGLRASPDQTMWGRLTHIVSCEARAYNAGLGWSPQRGMPTGARVPHFNKWLGMGGTVRTANKKLTRLYWLSRKRSPKRLIVLL